MDINAIVSLIGSLGFPIVVCILLLWYIKELLTVHKEETDSFTNALNRNTVVLQKLCDKLSIDISAEDE